jgi:hypothetical protein
MNNSNSGDRKMGLLAFTAGFFIMVAGWASWKSPQLNSEAFLQSLKLFVVVPMDELTRMLGNPFYFIGFIVLSVGFIITLIGIRKVIVSYFAG